MPEEKPGRPTRRRFVRVAAAMAGVPMMIAGMRALAPKAESHSWHGEVLGALSELTLWHTDAAFAQRTILRVRNEIERLERIFSLYRRGRRNSRPQTSGNVIKASPRPPQTVEE